MLSPDARVVVNVAQHVLFLCHTARAVSMSQHAVSVTQHVLFLCHTALLSRAEMLCFHFNKRTSFVTPPPPHHAKAHMLDFLCYILLFLLLVYMFICCLGLVLLFTFGVSTYCKL